MGPSETHSRTPAVARKVGLHRAAWPARRPDRILRWAIRSAFGDAPLRFVLQDGTQLWSPSDSPVASVVFRDRLSALRLFPDPEAQLGELYSKADIEIEGDLVAAIAAAYRALDRPERMWRRGWPAHGHSLRASRRNVQHHYDLGNGFYRLWLDEQLVYTCAYFPSPEVSLEEAQVAKLDRVCRKLGLKPGARVVEAGCGWGALALHMARCYGASVKAYNVSHEQVAFARERALREGLADLVEFVEDDYREIDGRFDAFVSVGMLEHVGTENYGRLGAVIDRCLDRSSGRGLVHFIGRDHRQPLNAWIRRYIFPGAYAPTLAQVGEGVLEPFHLSVLDVENLRLHYERTLHHWRTRFETAIAEVASRFDMRFARAWRLYLAGSEAAFRAGSLQLFQITFARSGSNAIPWTRAGLEAAG